MSVNKKEALLRRLSSSLKEDNTGANRRKWSNYIIANEIKLMDLVDLLNYERDVALRFSWLIGDLLELNPQVVSPCVGYLFSKRNEIQVLNFNRGLAKMFWLSGIPEEIEGEAADAMFKWILDAGSDVSIKNYSLIALYNLSLKHSELKQELIVVIEDQLGKNSSSFEKLATKILEKLKSATKDKSPIKHQSASSRNRKSF